MNQARVNISDPDTFDKIIRSMLRNWATWQDSIENVFPSPIPAKQPQFREVRSGFNPEDDDYTKHRQISRYDEAVYIEGIICQLSKHDVKVLERYFVKDQNTEICARKMSMSRRQFERWLNTAVGKVSIKVEEDFVGLTHARDVATLMSMVA